MEQKFDMITHFRNKILTYWDDEQKRIKINKQQDIIQQDNWDDNIYYSEVDGG